MGNVKVSIVDITLNRLSDMLKDIASDIKCINQEISCIKLVQIKQQAILDEHIRRTKINEDTLELHRSEVDARLAPLQEHVAMWAGACKLVITLGVIVGIVGTLYKLFF